MYIKYDREDRAIKGKEINGHRHSWRIVTTNKTYIKLIALWLIMEINIAENHEKRLNPIPITRLQSDR